jgi:tyrosyl-tRNA synthetase
LDKEKTTPYELYQFFLNQDDSQAENLIKRLTIIPLSEIEKIIKKHNDSRNLRYLQKKLAENVIIEIHGESSLKESILISNALFKSEISSLTKNQFKIATTGIEVFVSNENLSILEIMEKSKFTSSRRETREFLKNNAFRLNGKKIHDENIKLSKNNAMHDKYFLIQLGKKKSYIIELK